jgi:excinuclease UvrABC nuclease subunit
MLDVNKIIKEYKLGFTITNIEQLSYQDLPEDSAIYIFLLSKPFKRLNGESNILKIGETENLRKRMQNYFKHSDNSKLEDNKKRQTAYRLRYIFEHLLKNKNYKIEMYYKKLSPSDLKDGENLKNKEKNLLKEYFDTHFDMPPLNMGFR